MCVADTNWDKHSNTSQLWLSDVMRSEYFKLLSNITENTNLSSEKTCVH